MAYEYTAPGRIRAVALCVFHHQGQILVYQGHDPADQRTFLRPLGGGIEFGETSAATVVREIREELGLAAINLRLLGTFESIFTYCDAPHHEIIQVYDGEFADRSVYAKQFLEGREADSTSFRAHWRGRASLSSTMPLYPSGLQELLEAQGLLE